MPRTSPGSEVGTGRLFRRPWGARLGYPAILAAGLAGCGDRLPEHFEDCGDAECRSDWVVAAYGRDDAAGAEALASLGDPVERFSTLTRLLRTWPEKTQDLCQQISRGPSLELCERARTRPHLWSAPPDLPPLARKAGGPAGSELPMPSASVGRFAGVVAQQGPCARRIDAVACFSAAAVREARGGDVDRAAGACAAVDEPRWRADCMFSVAEIVADSRLPDRVGAASDLCLAAGAFASTCLGNLLDRFAQVAPDATAIQPAAWADTRAIADTLHQVWEGRDTAFAALVVSRYWSEATRLAYAWTPEVTGGPLDLLPAEAAPQIRASAAARLVALDGLESRSGLAAWGEALRTALASRATHAVPRPSQNLPHDHQILWPADRPGDEELPAIYYLGTGRRTVSADLAVDLQLCVLEAAARAGLAKDANASPGTRAAALALLAEGAQSTDAQIRWTAARLLQGQAR